MKQLWAGEGKGDDEYLITRLDCFYPALNIINCYGEQRKTRKEDVEEKWARIKKDMETILARNEFCCLAGDLNKYVGCGEKGVEGNKPEVSLGGRLLRELLATNKWFLVNSLGQDIVEGGPFTRKDPASGNESCLDLFIVSGNLLPYVKRLLIDSKREFAVARPVRLGGSHQLIYSDHYSCLLTLTNLPRVQNKKTISQSVWNLTKEGGWEKYHKLTEE